MQTSSKLIEKYSLHMKFYATLILEQSDNEDEVIKFIYAHDAELGPFMSGLRDLIDKSIFPEG